MAEETPTNEQVKPIEQEQPKSEGQEQSKPEEQTTELPTESKTEAVMSHSFQSNRNYRLII